MRIYVPRAVYTARTEYYTQRWSGRPWNGPQPSPPSVLVYNAICTPGNTEAIEVDSYFHDTKGRRINDCCHAKVVAEGKDKMPLLDVSAGKYTSRYTGYGANGWEGDPYMLPLPSTTFGIPTKRVINDGAFSIFVSTSFTVSKKSSYTTWFDVCVYGRVWDKTTYKCKRLERQLNMQFSGHAGDPTISGMAPVHAEWLGTYWWNGSLPSGYTPPASFFSIIAAAASGITTTFKGSNRYYDCPDSTPQREAILSELEAEARRWIRWGLDHNFAGWSQFWPSSYGLTYHPTKPEDFFLLQENKIVVEGYDPMVLSNHGLPSYWRNVLVQQAYLDAIDHVPRLNDNSISNIIEIAGFIKSLVIDHEVKMPESLTDAWLSYRYSFTTTKLDAEEAISFVARHRKLGSLSRWIKCYGESHHDYMVDGKTTPITCRCCFEIRPRDVECLARVWRALYTYGLQPNFYVVWDMIPYSFIIDWLIPIGSVAHAMDAQSNVTEITYELRDICFSLSYYNEDDYGNRYKLYTRWAQAIPQLNGFYFLEEDSASTKVIGMRILDSLSLIIGRR